MQTIKNDYEKSTSKTPRSAIEKSGAVKRRITKGILNNTGILVGFFLIFVVVVVFTTEINLASFKLWTQLGLTFFVLLFCSCSMYINCADSGIKAGKKSDTFLECKQQYDDIKKEIIEKNYQSRICEFCRFYVDQELEQTRTNILSEVGIIYEKYTQLYIGKDKASLQADQNLSKYQVAAILKANATKPVSLTAEMIFKRGRGSRNRHPLGVKPETKRYLAYVGRFIRIATTSVFTGVIVLDIIIEPTWATFAACCFKLLPIVLNGAIGYRMGYENITIDTVNYTNDQVDLMQQFVQYVTLTPEPAETVPDAEVVAAPASIPATTQV